MIATLALFRSYLSPAAKAAIEFPPYILEVITGMLLGDACLRKPLPSSDARLQIEQKDAGFVQWLWNLFASIGVVGAAPQTRTRSDKRTGNSSTSTQFATFTLPFLTWLFNLW
jgi:hypothetical protein